MDYNPPYEKVGKHNQVPRGKAEKGRAPRQIAQGRATKMNGFTHESTYNEAVEWYTPPSLFDSLGLRFDMDVASPGADIVPWIPADRHLTFEDSGLLQPWSGRVWCNPPYGSETAIWVERFCQHGNGVMLVFARTDTSWFHRHVRRADCICFIRGRVKFRRADGFQGGGSGAGSMLIAFGDDCLRALKQSRLGMVLTVDDGPSI